MIVNILNSQFFKFKPDSEEIITKFAQVKYRQTQEEVEKAT